MASFGSIDIQNSQIHIPSSGGNTAIGNGWQVYINRESRIRIANSEVSVRCASLGPAIGAACGLRQRSDKYSSLKTAP